MTSPPVRMAMSWSWALRRSPKAGALTAATLSVLRIAFTASVARASPSTSSATISSGLLADSTFSSSGSSSASAASFCVVTRTYASSSTASPASGSVTKCGETYPLSNCMPSVTSSSVVGVSLYTTVITPSRPTLLIASAIMSPTERSWAEMVATLATAASSATGMARLSSASLTAATAASMPRLSPAGLAPAARLRRPARTIAWASTVAVVVPSPAMSLVLVATSLTNCAPMFAYGSSISISLAMVTPSLVIVGGPNFLSSTTFRPRGPMVTLTASASALTPCSSRCLASSEKLRVFAMGFLWSLQNPAVSRVGPGRPAAPVDRGQRCQFTCGVSSLLDDGEHVTRGEHEVFLAPVLDLGAAVLRVDHDVADLHVNRDAVALVVEAAGAHREDGALLRLLLGRVRDHEARRRGGFGLVRLDHDPVLERLDGNLRRASHGHTLLGYLISTAWCQQLASTA